MSDFDRPDIDDIELERTRERVAGLMAEGGVAMDDPSLWSMPSAELESAIMAEIGEAPTVSSASSPRIGRHLKWLVPVAAAAAILVAFVGFAGRPDWTATMQATDAAPGASAVVSGWNEASGTRMRLDITGLDPAPEGHVYELWLSNRDVHISAGTFHGTGDGVTLWAGVARADYPRVWITLEPLDADPSPAVNVLDTAVGQT